MNRLVLIGQYYNSSGKVGGGRADQLAGGGDQVMGWLRAEYGPGLRRTGPSTSRR